jgi:hypothetical protein
LAVSSSFTKKRVVVGFARWAKEKKKRREGDYSAVVALDCQLHRTFWLQGCEFYTKKRRHEIDAL